MHGLFIIVCYYNQNRKYLDKNEKEKFKGLIVETEKKDFETQKEYFLASLGLKRKTMT